MDIATESVEIRRLTGYLPGGIALYDSLSGEQVLDYLVDMQGRQPIGALSCASGWSCPHRS